MSDFLTLQAADGVTTITGKNESENRFRSSQSFLWTMLLTNIEAISAETTSIISIYTLSCNLQLLLLLNETTSSSLLHAIIVALVGSY